MAKSKSGWKTAVYYAVFFIAIEILCLCMLTPSRAFYLFNPVFTGIAVTLFFRIIDIEKMIRKSRLIYKIIAYGVGWFSC